jgi:hypothetical protein
MAKEKMLRVTMPDGSKWDVPAKLIAENRARHYADKTDDRRGDDYREEFDLAMGDEFTLKDWAAGDMNWEDVAAEARLVDPPDMTPDQYQEGWVNGDKEVVEVEVSDEPA